MSLLGLPCGCKRAHSDEEDNEEEKLNIARLTHKNRYQMVLKELEFVMIMVKKELDYMGDDFEQQQIYYTSKQLEEEPEPYRLLQCIKRHSRCKRFLHNHYIIGW